MIKGDLVDLARRLYGDLRITKTVYNEVVVRGRQKGYSDAYVAEAEIQNGKVGIVECQKSDWLPALSRLHPGEAETILEAKNEVVHALLDDIKSKLIAEEMGVKYISIDLLLIEALLKDLIDFQEFERLARRMNDICGMRSDRYAELQHIGILIQEMKK